VGAFNPAVEHPHSTARSPDSRAGRGEGFTQAFYAVADAAVFECNYVRHALAERFRVGEN
jgi:hypothetical protein